MRKHETLEPIDESILDGESPSAYAMRVSEAKARVVHGRHPAAVVLAAAAFLRGYGAKAGLHNALMGTVIALGIAVATRCEGCIGFHTETLVRLGVSKEEFEETLGMAVYMGGGPALMYAADAIAAFDQFTSKASA